jgi:sodium/hydrogen exchanger 8
MYGFSAAIDGKLTFISSLVFGSLISSTDPVTVLSLLPSNVDKKLYMLIFGESALNDAVSIILYRFFTSLTEADLEFSSFVISVFVSAGVFLGSFLVGTIMALIYAKITKHIEITGSEGAIFEGVMLLIFAYSSYMLAEVLQLTGKFSFTITEFFDFFINKKSHMQTGIISIFFCGIAMAHYAYHNLAEETTRTMKVTIRIISFMCECFIFLYLGMGLLSFGDQAHYDPLYVICAVISILVSRTHVFLILGFNNMIPKNDKIPLSHQVLIWFSGLRGAVAFALAVTFLELPQFTKQVKGVIFGTTVIVLTVLILGGLTPYMLVWLGIQKPKGDGHDDGESGEKDHDQEKKEEDEYELSEKYMNKPFFGLLYRLDAT